MKTINIASWDEFLELSSRFSSEGKIPKYLFRGQANDKWDLQTSISRFFPHKVNRAEAERYEIELLERFSSEYNSFRNSEIELDVSYGDISKLAIMQHYQCPTRLLDWTESIFVSLYFAVESELDSNGVIYLFPFSLLDEGFKVMKMEELNTYQDKDIIFTVFPQNKTKRICLQQGWFTVSNNIVGNQVQLIESKCTSEYVFKVIINKKDKPLFLSYLHNMNISGKTLFGDLDGLGKWNRERLIINRFFDSKNCV